MNSRATSRTVHVRAPGKINVFLKVGAQLDDGYHDVAIAYQAVSLYEEVRVVESDDFDGLGHSEPASAARKWVSGDPDFAAPDMVVVWR